MDLEKNRKRLIDLQIKIEFRSVGKHIDQENLPLVNLLRDVMYRQDQQEIQIKLHSLEIQTLSKELKKHNRQKDLDRTLIT